MAQTTSDFRWIVLMDAGTPERFRLKSCYYETLYVSDWLNDLQAALNMPGWIATTRLDNDDAIHPEFMATIQQHLIRRKRFLNIPNGWQLKGGKHIPIQHTANPFMTLVEGGNKSIYFMPHGRAMSKYAPIIQISERRLWTQIIHERNYING
jgi:hypothetical protein